LALGSSVAVSAGDPEKGRALYGVCAACHGPKAEGMRELNAPALAGREDWYLARQIENFKKGIRGAHPDDVYGRQMAPMAQVLADTQAIEDVVAYLTSLGD
jgi:cytochrome c oxidase subunit 2